MTLHSNTWTLIWRLVPLFWVFLRPPAALQLPPVNISTTELDNKKCEIIFEKPFVWSQSKKDTKMQSIMSWGPRLRHKSAVYLLSEGAHTAEASEFIVLRAGLGLRAGRFGSQEPVSRALLLLLPLVVSQSYQGIQLLTLLHLLLGGQHSCRPRL